MSDATALPQAPGSKLTNVPDYTVTELAGALKRTVEDRFGSVRLRGEVSNYRGPHSSGHAYFCLKDEGARIDAVVWRTAFARLRIKPEEGMEVWATGRITTFPGKSSYQIVIESLEPAGIGALMAMVEERRRRLAAEGLFEAARKQPLPFLPHSIGVVTSPTGAVIRDILQRIEARFPRRVIVWPVRVQGEGSAGEVSRAIRGFNLLAEAGAGHAPHILIVARGGGSLEDLWGFNDEAVVRAAAESLIPIISAVGHETDWTLLDHVADVRAPTPTGAAELSVPVRQDLAAALDRVAGRHAAAALRLIERGNEALRAVTRALPSGSDLLAAPRQRLDHAGARLPAGLRLNADRQRLALARLGARLVARSPRAHVARDRERLAALGARLWRTAPLAKERRDHRVAVVGSRLTIAFGARLRLAGGELRASRARLETLSGRLRTSVAAAVERRAARSLALGQLLATLSYRNVLGRGFALVRDEAGHPLWSAAGVASGARLVIELADGSLPAEVTNGEATAGATRPGRKVKGAGPRQGPQGSLF